MWDKEFRLPDGSYFVSDIQGYFEYIIKKHETFTDNLSIRIYVNKIGNRITFRIKTGHFLELLTPETMKLLESTKIKITKDENGENMSHLETTEIVLVHCNIVNNNYHHDTRVFYTFVPNKLFGQFLDIWHNIFTFKKKFNWFTDQNSKFLEIEHKMNITLVIN